MFRTFTVIMIVCLVSGLVGCRFCASPYDYCSPTYTGNNCESYHGDPCHPNYTAGSRFLGTEEVCRSHCGTCGEYSENGCSSCENKLETATEPTRVPVTKVSKPNAKSLASPVKKIPDPPPAPRVNPVIAVPNAIQGASVAKTNVPAQTTPRELSAPKPVVPQTNYAKQTVKDLSDSALSDPATMLNELKELHPDAEEVKIIGFEE